MMVMVVVVVVVICTQCNFRPQYGFPHFHKASTEIPHHKK